MFRTKRAAELVDRAGRLAASAADADGYDLEMTIGRLVGAVSMYREAGDEEEARRGQAGVARTLANQYVKIGMRDRAAAFAFEYFTTLPDRDRELLAIAYTASMLDIAGHPAQLVEFARRCNRADLPEPLYSVATILSQRAGADDFGVDELAAAARMLTHVPIDLRVQCALFAANALVVKHAAARAVDVLTDLRTGVAVDPIQDARLAQALGAAAARAGDPDLALRMQLLAWGRYNELRYHVGSMRLRRAIDGQLTRLRPSALTAAARVPDLRLMLELIESSRLQANVALPGSLDELDQVLATGEYEKPPGPSDAYHVDATALPEVYQLTVDDLFEGRADVDDRVDLHVGGVSALAGLTADDGRRSRSRRLDVEAVLGRHAGPDDLWWSSWYDGGVLFWVLSRGAVPIDGGVTDIAGDEELLTALSTVLLRSGVTPRWPIPGRVGAIDLERYLRHADAPDELALTSTLARLLPARLRSSEYREQRLFMSIAPELAAVPWPILPIDPTVRPATRLIEHFELRFLPSLAVLNGIQADAASSRPAAEPLRLLLTCDYFPVKGIPGPLPVRRADTVLAAKQLCGPGTGIHEATTMNLVRWMRRLPRGAEGVAFFRAHYEWVDADPSSSGIALADGELPSGMLAARDAATGRTLLNLPNTVVMSCCSTSGNRERNGGETLGLAPLAMMAGARRLIVTSVDIRHTEFTVAFDNMLIDLAMLPGDHFTALRRQQLCLLDAWRRWDHRDLAGEDDFLPTPEIWAHYQAFGA